jgi:hypothetical protein
MLKTPRYISVDDWGIRQHRGFLGWRPAIEISWQSVSAWSTSEVALRSVNTGREQVVEEVLEIESGENLDCFKRSSLGKRCFASLVEELRVRLPEKWTPSIVVRRFAGKRGVL